MRRILTVVGLALAPVAAQGQGTTLDQAGEAARRAWFRHDAAGLVANTSRVVIRLPGVEPSPALGQAQATALLQTFLDESDEVATVLVAAREVEAGRGYVELERRYRVSGTQEVRVQSLLFGYRQGGKGWQLVEIRVAG